MITFIKFFSAGNSIEKLKKHCPIGMECCCMLEIIHNSLLDLMTWQQILGKSCFSCEAPKVMKIDNIFDSI